MVERTITLLYVQARAYCENQRTWYTSYCIDSLTVNLVSACAVIEYRTFNQAKRLLRAAVWGIFCFDTLRSSSFFLFEMCKPWDDMAVLQLMRYWETHARTNKCSYAHTSWYVRLQPSFLSLALHCYSLTFLSTCETTWNKFFVEHSDGGHVVNFVGFWIQFAMRPIHK